MPRKKLEEKPQKESVSEKKSETLGSNANDGMCHRLGCLYKATIYSNAGNGYCCLACQTNNGE